MELAALGRGGARDRPAGLRLSFLAVYGPISVMLLLVLWAGLMILAFAMIYHGLGPRFQAASGPIGFGTLLYMSGVDVPDARARRRHLHRPARPALHDPRDRDGLHSSWG